MEHCHKKYPIAVVFQLCFKEYSQKEEAGRAVSEIEAGSQREAAIGG
jgi:hypothetical protein